MKLIAVACLVLVACGPSVNGSEVTPSLPPDWSVRDAAGLRIAAPNAWSGPVVLPATDVNGDPRPWVVLSDAAGLEPVIIMTWRNDTASARAAAQFDSEWPRGDAPKELTLVDGSRTRTVVAMSGYAQWSDASGAGTYECRHLYVQVDPRSVAVVIACGPHSKGNTTPPPQLRRLQDQVALRLGVAGGAP